ncbi:RluA family pseudouridine synthase [Granulibacter bethesdensis]|uniref:RluA family pseudouridine synthase n=1 Tax=Granulibacter bethesdensis TaxID=364410 RepID=UPI0003F1F0DA|nr:RluA family pseudouridine synthase [Granulibacter bethesdensis]AHJ64467.1 Ribosomal large subunit pseudouridine synthase A [Granulibacter bethesdensis CGDNIH4]
MTPRDLLRAGPDILYQDQHFVVLNKPAGLPAHAGPAGGPSVEDWFPLLSRRKEGPWLAHRLDTDTSGCLIIALRKTPLLEAQAMFAKGQAGKRYWAVVRGAPPAAEGRIDRKLSRHSESGEAGRGHWRMVEDAQGQSASTSWRIMEHQDGLSWLELSPLTGRTHQLRVHCALLGCPILGDPVYGDGRDAPLCLLACEIRLPLDPVIRVRAPVPTHMRRYGFSFPSP